MNRNDPLPWKKILSGAATFVLALAAIFLVFLAYGTIANRFYRVVTIDGDSMAPTFHYGDQVIVLPPKPDLPAGTIVLLSVDGRLVTHRLLGYQNGAPITQGDANRSPDDFSGSHVRVVGVYAFHIPKIGYASLTVKRLAANWKR